MQCLNNHNHHCNAILSSSKISSFNCLRNIEKGNLLLILFFETDSRFNDI